MKNPIALVNDLPSAARRGVLAGLPAAPQEYKLGPLSRQELLELLRHEKTIARGLDTFQEVGDALLAVRDGQLYRGKYGSFEEYLAQRWKLGARYGRNLMSAARTGRLLADARKDQPELPMPTSESQLRPLSGLPEEKRVETYAAAARAAGGKAPTAKEVQSAKRKVQNEVDYEARRHAQAREADKRQAELVSEAADPDKAFGDQLGLCLAATLKLWDMACERGAERRVELLSAIEYAENAFKEVTRILAAAAAFPDLPRREKPVSEPKAAKGEKEQFCIVRGSKNRKQYWGGEKDGWSVHRADALTFVSQGEASNNLPRERQGDGARRPVGRVERL